MSWQVEFHGYVYPGAPPSLNYNYFEVIPSAGWDFGPVAVTGGVAISPNYFGGSRLAVWPYGEVTVPIPLDVLTPYKVAFIGHFGYQFIERNANFGTPDYAEWTVGAQATVYGLNVKLQYVDTNLSKAKCFGGTTLCKAAALFTVSKTF